MLDYFKEKFQSIADSYKGEYYLKEEVVGGIGGSSLPLSNHCIIVPYNDKSIYFNIEFGGTASGSVKTEIRTPNELNIFKFKKREHLLSLFKKSKNSLTVVSENLNNNLAIEGMLETTGLEELACQTLFEPSIVFRNEGETTQIELFFSMAFKDKEWSIVPIIEFLKKLIDFIEREA